jgi:heme iron utilization protein
MSGPGANAEGPEARRQARSVLRGALTASLATLAADGAPHCSLVLVACRPDATPILLLSQLSAHTKNIARDPRVALMADSAPMGDDPLDRARITVLGTAARTDDAARRARDRARFLAKHPPAALYADFGDFAFFAVTAREGHFVGGFARARAIAAEALVVPEAPALEAAAAEIVAHMNRDHAEAVALYATRLLGRPPGPWTMTGIDPEGIDLRAGGLVARLDFEAPVATAEAARRALVALAKSARTGG